MKSDSKKTRKATSAEPEERTTTQRRGHCTQHCEEHTRKWHAQKKKQANNTATYTDRKRKGDNTDSRAKTTTEDTARYTRTNTAATTADKTHTDGDIKTKKRDHTQHETRSDPTN